MYKKLTDKSVKTKLLIGAGVLVGTLIAILIVVSYKEKKNFLLQEAKKELEGQYNLVHQRIADTAYTTYCLAEWLANTHAIQKGFIAQETEQLVGEALPVYRAVRDKLSIDRLRLIIRSGKTAGNGNSLPLAGKIDDGFSISTAPDVTPSSRAGVISKEDGLYIQGSSGVVFHNKTVGLVELAKNLDIATVTNFADRFGFQFSVIQPAGESYRFINDPKLFIVPTELKPAIDRVLHSGQAETIRPRNNTDQLFFLGPLKDNYDTEVGLVAVQTDIKAQLAQLRKHLITYVTYVLSALIATILIIVSIYLVIEKLINQLIQDIVEKFKKAGKGDLTQRMKAKAMNCSQAMNCGNTECKMYGKTGRCWEEAGSLAIKPQCPRIITGEYQSCSECKEVYQQVFDNEISSVAN